MALETSLLANWTLNESSGNITDNKGSNTGTNEGTATFAAGKIANGCALNGSSQGFAISDITGNTNFTYNMWAKFTNASPTNDTMIQTNDCQIVQVGSTLYCQAWVDRNGTTGTNKLRQGSTTVSDLQVWKMITFVATGTSYKVYINGSDVSASFANDSPSRSYAISRIGHQRSTAGPGSPANSAWLNGMLDEISVWTAEKSASEISTLYNSGNGMTFNGTIFVAPAAGPANLKTYNTNIKSNIKTINTNVIANVKTLNTNA